MPTRLAGGAVAALALAIYFAVLAMVGGYAVSQLLTIRTFAAVQSGVQQELGWIDLPVFVLKAGGLGALVAWRAATAQPGGSHSASAVARHTSRSFASSLVAAALFSATVTLLLYLLIGAPAPP
jgi:ABC-type transporter Mla maintaining outer membrane lipid asymmetry permease subunit MlaE